MFNLLSKIANLSLEPMTWLVLGMAVAVWKSKAPLRRWLLAGWICLLLLSNPWVADLAIKSWEIGDYPKGLKANDYDGIVVLGGGCVFTRDDTDKNLHVGQTVDRLFQGVRLWQAKAAPRILFSGGTDPLLSAKPSEAVMARNVLLSLGVPDSAIVVEPASRSTWENAAATAALVNQSPDLFPRKRLLLVTSSLHLRRAVWCFQRHGLVVTPYPSDFRSSSELPTTLLSWINSCLPSAEALDLWGALLHEWMGNLGYRLRYG